MSAGISKEDEPGGAQPPTVPPVRVEDAAVELDAARASGTLTEDEADRLRDRLGALHDSVKDSFDRERSFLEKARALRQGVREERIALEKSRLEKDKLAHDVRRLVEDKEKALSEQVEAERQNGTLHLELSELQQRQAARREELKSVRKQNEDLVEPVLTSLRAHIAKTDSELDSEASRHKHLQSHRTRLTSRLDAAQVAAEGGEAQLRTMRAEWRRVRANPDRLGKQLSSVHKAVEQVRLEVDRLRAKRDEAEARKADTQTKHQETKAVQKAAEEQLQAHHRDVQERQHDAAEVERSIRSLRDEQAELVERKKEAQLRAARADVRLRTAVQGQQARKSRYSRALKDLRRRVDLANQARAVLPEAQGAVNEAQATLRGLRKEHEDKQRGLEALAAELDLLTLKVREQMGKESRSKQALDEVLAEERRLEEERDGWRGEEGRMTRQVSELKEARDTKVRELERVRKEIERTREEQGMKELAMTDLAKQHAEVEGRLRHAGELFEAVKAERNSYVNAIQAAAQALAERKERVKILAHELQILQSESGAKDQALQREKDALVKSQERLKGRRAECNRERAVFRERQSAVSHQLGEIDRLTGVIARAEKGMLRLKQQYEAAVEARNFAGVQVIDRNDELCVLYEKSAAHDDSLRKGEAAMKDADGGMAALELRRQELERQLRLSRAKFPRLPELAGKVLTLQREVREARDTATRLAQELEDPGLADRWAPLEGQDPDEDNLRSTVEELEARLGSKREELLEKELVLEEVTGVAEKLRTQAKGGREEASGRAVRVTALQGRIRALTREIMAAVSELSMWQAAAVKLQQEKEEADEELGVALAAQAEAQDAQSMGEGPGEAPTERAQRALLREEEKETWRLQGAAKRAAEAAAPRTAHGDPTTAQPRFNAYVPSEVGLARPYGALAPFKPQAPGAQMRHFKAPKAKPVEL